MIDPAILTASPTVGAWRARPMSVSEIDAHPDADRIWATIKGLRDEAGSQFDADLEREKDDSYEEGKADEASNSLGLVDDAIAEIERRIGDDLSEQTRRAMDEIWERLA